MMLAVHPMKLSPLTRGQRPKDGMVEHSGSLAEAGFASRNHFVHSRDPRPDFAYDLFTRHAARLSTFRRFPSLGQVSKSGDHKCSHAILQHRPSRQRLAFLQNALESLYGSSVGEIEVLQHFRGAP